MREATGVGKGPPNNSAPRATIQPAADIQKASDKGVL